MKIVDVVVSPLLQYIRFSEKRVGFFVQEGGGERNGLLFQQHKRDLILLLFYVTKLSYFLLKIVEGTIH